MKPNIGAPVGAAVVFIARLAGADLEFFVGLTLGVLLVIGLEVLEMELAYRKRRRK